MASDWRTDALIATHLGEIVARGDLTDGVEERAVVARGEPTPTPDLSHDAEVRRSALAIDVGR